MRVKLVCVAGGRPNFPKLAALFRALGTRPERFETCFVHTGQHSDPRMSKLFCEELGLPAPSVDLGVGSATHAVQVAEVMRRFEAVLQSEQPQMQGRLRGYLRAVEEHGLQEHVHFIPFHKDYDILVDRVKEYLAQENGLDAILFGANYLGVRGLEAITKMGRKIPHDLAVVSFDDNDLFRVSTPSITAISQPIEKISELIITTLLERIASGEPPTGTEPTGVFLPTQLLIRDSSARKA